MSIADIWLPILVSAVFTWLASTLIWTVLQLNTRETTIEDMKKTVTKLKVELKGSVMKTRQLREELIDRAAENIKSEVKLRDVETELSIARASTDLIATGVLDYTEEEDEKSPEAVLLLPI